MNSHRVWTLITLVILGVFLYRIPDVSFHPDETLALRNSILFNKVLDGVFESPDDIIMGEKSTRNFMVGFTRYLGGYVNRFVYDWNWTISEEANREAGNFPPEDLLWWGRFGSAIASAIAYVIGLWFARKVGGWLAVLLGLIFLLPNTFLGNTLGRVREDGLVLALVMLTAYLSYRALENWERGRSGWRVLLGWLAVSLVAGTAAAAKLTGGAMALLPPVLIFLHILRSHRTLLRQSSLWLTLGGLTMSLGLTAFFSFASLNPALINNPFMGTVATLNLRTDKLESMFYDNEGARIDGLVQWVAAMIERNFQSLQTFEFPGALIVYLLLFVTGLVIVGRQTRKWYFGDTKGRAAMIFLLATVLFSAVSLIPLKTDWPRYYFPSVFAVLILQSIGLAAALAWLEHRLAGGSIRAKLAFATDAVGRQARSVVRSTGRLVVGSDFLVIFAIFFFIYLAIFPMLADNRLFSLDPWRHYFTARFGESQVLFTRQVPGVITPIGDSYATTFRSNVFFFTELTDIDTYSTMRFFSLFQRGLYLILSFAVIRVFGLKRRWALLSVLLLGAGFYFVWRSSQAWPENQVLLMHMLALWGFERHRRSGEKRALVVVGLAFVGSIYSHPPSNYVFLFLMAAYSVPALLDRDWATLRSFAAVAGVSLLVALPSFESIFRPFINTFLSNFGESSDWGRIATEQARYDPVDITFYLAYVGPGLIILSVVGLIAASRSGEFKEYFPLVVTFLFGFALSLSTHYDLFIPPLRSMGYFFIAIAPLAAISMKTIAERATTPIYTGTGIALVGLLSFMVLFSTPPYPAYPGGEIESAEQINAILAQNPHETVGYMSEVMMWLADDIDGICRAMQQTSSGHYNTRVFDPDDVRCLDPYYMVVSTSSVQALPGYVLAFESENYALWQRSR